MNVKQMTQTILNISFKRKKKNLKLRYIYELFLNNLSSLFCNFSFYKFELKI